MAAQARRAPATCPVPVELGELKKGGGSVKCCVAELRAPVTAEADARVPAAAHAGPPAGAARSAHGPAAARAGPSAERGEVRPRTPGQVGLRPPPSGAARRRREAVVPAAVKTAVSRAHAAAERSEAQKLS